MKTLLSTLAGLGLMLAATFTPASAQQAKDAENTVVLELKTGKVMIQLRPDLAPRHVERIKKLSREGFYNGLKFHRVINGFMAQTGDPRGTGTGGSKYENLPAEFTKTRFDRGALGMARSQSPDSANSQFFIMFQRSIDLEGSYTVWGNVSEGMEFVDQIKKGDPSDNGAVKDPDIIVKMYVLADASKPAAPAAAAKPAPKAGAPAAANAAQSPAKK